MLTKLDYLQLSQPIGINLRGESSSSQSTINNQQNRDDIVFNVRKSSRPTPPTLSVRPSLSSRPTLPTPSRSNERIIPTLPRSNIGLRFDDKGKDEDEGEYDEDEVNYD